MYTIFSGKLRLEPEAQASRLWWIMFYKSIVLGLNIDVLSKLNMDPRIALRLSEDDDTKQ